MILTLYYMLSTFVQWWRLGALKAKLHGTLNAQNAVLVCNMGAISGPSHARNLENLLVHNDNRIVCTVVPRQTVNLSHWVAFPKDFRYFPIHISGARWRHESAPSVHHILIESKLEHYSPHQGDNVEIEQFGELLAWKASNSFEIIMRTDLENITKLIFWFSNNRVDINHDLELLKIELVDVRGEPSHIKYDTKYSLAQTLCYSLSPKHWSSFVISLQNLYSKISAIQPKIRVENGTKSTVPDAKPMKKELKKKVVEHNKLDVHSSKSHKSGKDKEAHQKSKDMVPLKVKERVSEVLIRVESASDSDNQAQSFDSVDGPIKSSTERILVRVDPIQESTILVPEDLSKELIIDVAPTIVDNAAVVSEEIALKTVDNVPDNKVIDVVTPPQPQQNAEVVASVTPEATANATSSTPISKVSSSQVKAEPVATSKTTSTVTAKPSTTTKSATSSKPKLVKTKDDSKSKTKELERAKQLKEEKAREDAKLKQIFKEEKLKEKKAQKELEKARQEREKRMLKNSRSSKSSKDSFLSASTASGLSTTSSRSYSDAAKSSPTKPANTKPTNILIYSESNSGRDNVKRVLQSILNVEKYTIYDLPTNAATNSWRDSTNLVIICGNVNPTLTHQLLEYLVTGGQLLCLCSDLLYGVLQTFSTAEVREHELVKFSYGEWKRVQNDAPCVLLPGVAAKKQFSKDSCDSGASNGSSPVAPRTPSVVEMQHAGKNYTVQVQVLGSEETWQTPSLMLATIRQSCGKAFFSQVHLEIDPTQYQDDENKFAALKESNSARLEILRDILGHFDVDCSAVDNKIDFGPAYFLGTYDLKLDLLKNSESIENNEMKTEKMSLIFCNKTQDPGVATATRLPVLVHSCPNDFSTIDYFENLKTTDIGRLVIYADLMVSTHQLVEKKLRHGFVVLARQQCGAIGRSSNVWISPKGSCAISLQLHVPLRSNIGQRLSLVQHLATAAFVDAIKSEPGCEHLDIGIKWPNDIYAERKFKVGGVMATSTVMADLAVLNLGCGINLDNSDPTTCINDILRQCNPSARLFSYERFLALLFSRLEELWNSTQQDGTDELMRVYYKHWLHSDAEVTINPPNGGESKSAKIVGLDAYGFLEVESPSGERMSVHPDGNTFDMLKGLIAPKIF